jgi:predicted helicase
LGLLSQTLREWSLNADSPFEYLAVCSDPSVDSDELIEHTADLGIPVTTEVEVILDFMRRDGRIVIFSTYQSSPRLAESYTGRGNPVFDLIILDEAPHGGEARTSVRYGSF